MPLRAAARALAPFLAIAGAGSVLAAPAFGHEPPKYSLKIVQGETTQPEDSVAGVSANASNRAVTRVRIIQAGTIVHESTSREGEWGTGLSQVPLVGDEVTVESPLGTVVGSVDYDGLPTIDATVCAGSTNFSGQRSGAETVEGGYFTEAAVTNPYGQVEGYEQENRGQAQVTLLSGPTFGGVFLAPLSFGETVYASEAIEVPLAGGAVFTYESETIRPVGGCPLPPAPPPPPPAPVVIPLKASIARVTTRTIKALLKHGLADSVYVNQAGEVTQGLYLEDGALPAYVASARHRHKKPPALLLARGASSAKGAGDVTVTLHLTARGRAWLRSAKRMRAVLITTVTDASGARVTLAHHTVSLPR
ncbi:MAG TPA: hypothetical protein VGY13_09570 [Solirubrobacteraceae bacterium]|nr:hypothetical protein [Solirubrobacteraceae bacterium]